MATTATESSVELITTNVVEDRYPTIYPKANTLSVGVTHAMMVKSDGTLWATGNNYGGQFGNGTTTDSTIFIDTGVTNVQSVFCGQYSTFIVKVDGSLWAAGSGDGESAYWYGGDAVLGVRTTDNTIFVDTGLRNVIQVASSRYTTLACTADGSLYGTGDNDLGQLGLGDTRIKEVFTLVPDIKAIRIATGGRHSLIVTPDYEVWGTGDNTTGQLGTGDTIAHDEFVKIEIGVLDVAAGRGHSLLLTVGSHTVYSMGLGLDGQLGLGDQNDRTSPTAVSNTAGTIMISAGFGSSCILNSSSIILATGRNHTGQLGLGDITDRNVFTSTGVTADMVTMAVDAHHAVALSPNNMCQSTGDNYNGQLGLGDTTDRNVFTDTNVYAGTFVNYRPLLFANDKVVANTNIYLVTTDELRQTALYDLVLLQPSLPYLPFDSRNTSVAYREDTLSYTVTSITNFNSFVLAGLIGDQVVYTIKDSGGTTLESDTVTIDCTIDDQGLLPKSGVTLLLSLATIYPEGTTIELTISTNTSGESVYLGNFTTNLAIDEGVTDLQITAELRDYNSYTPDAWGNIEEGVKPITRQFNIKVSVPYAQFDKTYRRHLTYAGKFLTIDGTDANVERNDMTLHSLTARGLVTSVSHATITKGARMANRYTYTMKFLEIV